MQERDSLGDSIRAVCILWIICVAHMDEYMGYDWSSFPIPYITKGVLGTFTFLSGYYNGKKDFTNSKKIVDFYRNRFFKIYIPYLLSCCSMFVLHYTVGLQCITTWKQFVKAFLGLSMLLGKSPATIWYIEMLVIFYIITPLIMGSKNRKVKIGILVAVGLFILSKFVLRIDKRLAVYYPFYMLGLLFPAQWIMLVKHNKTFRNSTIIIGIIGFSLLATVYNYKSWDSILIIMILLFIISILSLGNIIEICEPVKRILSKLSYCGMFVYLFHRQIFGILYYLLGNFNFCFAYLVALPILIVIGYYMQMKFDIFLKILKYKQWL